MPFPFIFLSYTKEDALNGYIRLHQASRFAYTGADVFFIVQTGLGLHRVAAWAGFCMASPFLEAYIYESKHNCICSYNFSIQYPDNVIQFGAAVISL